MKFLVTIVLLLGCVICNPVDHDYQYDEPDDDNISEEEEVGGGDVDIEMISTGQVVRVVPGDFLSLPCLVKSQGDDINRIWSRPDLKKNQIISVGTSFLNETSRKEFAINGNGNLEILSVMPDHSGKFQCQVVDNIKVVHEVIVGDAVIKHSEIKDQSNSSATISLSSIVSSFIVLYVISVISKQSC